MKKYCMLIAVLAFLGANSSAQQNADKTFNAKEVERIERILSSDDMQGRKIFSPGIDKAADFIASEFKAVGLSMLSGASSFRQPFEMLNAVQKEVSGKIDDQKLNDSSVVVVSSATDLHVTDKSGYEVMEIKAGANLGAEASRMAGLKKNILVVVDTSFGRNFQRLRRLGSMFNATDKTVVFLLASKIPSSYDVNITQEVTHLKMANVIGMLPGKSKKNEYVIFSGHYDHLGTRKAVNGDSVFNGANDDATGITAVILLAKYFKQLGNNERTLVFAAFTGEEIGGFGSRYFSQQFDPSTVMAMFNIEMIGTESKWGKNSAYITGYEKTDMGEILGKNLKGTEFTFHPDPYISEDLFYRSDNATLARQGVPAHTISTSKMDSEKFYHTVDDEIETLDMNNMAMIIKAIAISSAGIVAGDETPSRVNVSSLRR